MNKIGLTILILILFFTCASAVASDMNETVVTSEDQSDELIEIDNCDDSGLLEFNQTDMNDILEDDKRNVDINTDVQSIYINSTKKGEIKIINISDGVDNFEFDKNNLSITATCHEANKNINIPITGFDVIGGNISFELENSNFTEATLTINYNDGIALKNITLNRVYNAKIDIINAVNEYKTGNFTFRLVDVDDRTSLAGRILTLTTGGNIRAGHTARTDINGIASYKNANLFEYNSSVGSSGTLSLDPIYLEVGNHSVVLESSGNVKLSKVTTNLTITPGHFRIVVGPYEEYYGSDKKVKITVTNAYGEAVQGITLHSYMPQTSKKDHYFQTDANGTAEIEVTGFVGGTYNITVSNNDTKNIIYCSTQSVITILDRPVIISVTNVSFSEDIIIEMEIPNNISGIIEAYVCNQSFNGAVENGKGSIILTDLNAGIYNIELNFTNNISLISYPVTFEIYKTVPEIHTEPINVRVNDYLRIHITQPERITGNLTIDIGGKNYSSVMKNGYAYFNINDLKVEDYVFAVYYLGNDNYYACNFTYELSVIPLEKPDLNLDIYNIVRGEDMLIEPTVSGCATGTFDIYVDDKYNCTIDVGDSYLLLEPETGQHKIEIIYSGDVNFESKSLMKIFKVYSTSLIIAEDTKIIIGGDNHFQAQFFDESKNVLVNKIVIFNVNGSDFSARTDENGVAFLNHEFDIGNYIVTSINPIANIIMTNNLLIFSTVLSTDVYAVDNTDFEFNATFLDGYEDKLINIPVLFEINGEEKVVRTNDDGVAGLKLNLNLGIYNITSINTLTDEIKINKIFVTTPDGKYTYDIPEKDMNIPALPNSPGSSVTIRLPDDASGNITLDIGGKNYNIKVAEGKANVKLPDLANGDYIYTITYSGDMKYSPFTKTGTVNIKKQTAPLKPAPKITISLKAVKVKKSAKKLVLQATLKQGKNPLKFKRVIFKFNGKKYTANTNKKGIAKVAIKKKVLKKLKVGKKVKIQVKHGKVTSVKTTKVKK